MFFYGKKCILNDLNFYGRLLLATFAFNGLVKALIEAEVCKTGEKQ